MPPSHHHHHHRSLSRGSTRSLSPRSPSPPSQTFHSSILPHPIPTPALVESVAGAAHYSGVKVDPETLKHRRASIDRRETSTNEPVKADHQRIMADLKELYCCRPTMEIFERSWNKDAVFEDPLSYCKGYKEYAAQWFVLPKLCSKSETLSTRIMSSTSSPNRLVFAQKQEYTARLFGHKKVIDSIVVVDLDREEKIVRLVDQWDGKVPTWFGSHTLRRANAKVVPWLVHVPKQA
ncbi:uncharacterized protein BT62DRAFT_18530 [Guyanagaster necrorhizus]|uniref:Uncharacterized protein n=1 Tax=Guyanagaster necrorhizus TaxID=856835 RepID=A0A9P8AYX6_9AGAR|nr:uncharacterized protein BT62DRAFT_18530 [Guyanagaster necrorhizus MCA 3950]KAG7452691.1 hypothetical protein BT62DRAFT_18530 [Guyanagaster necrorhizus MCA 3950]